MDSQNNYHPNRLDEPLVRQQRSDFAPLVADVSLPSSSPLHLSQFTTGLESDFLSFIT